MKYTVHYSPEHRSEDGPKTVGIEIQPPMDVIALQGLGGYLTNPDVTGKGNPYVEGVAVVRQDKEGTALKVQPHRLGTPPPPRQIAELIGRTINPTGLHIVQYMGHPEQQ